MTDDIAETRIALFVIDHHGGYTAPYRDEAGRDEHESHERTADHPRCVHCAIRGRWRSLGAVGFAGAVRSLAAGIVAELEVRELIRDHSEASS